MALGDDVVLATIAGRDPLGRCSAPFAVDHLDDTERLFGSTDSGIVEATLEWLRRAFA